MNVIEGEELTREELIEDYICQAFVMGLGTRVPSNCVLTFMIKSVIISVDESGAEITEQYVRDYIPTFIDNLYRQNF